MLISYGLFKLSCFNPLIGGADRATGGIPPFKKCMTQIAFQSPHRRGGSRDLRCQRRDGVRNPGFQSPHRRGGSRDKKGPVICRVEESSPFQSPHRRGGSRDSAMLISYGLFKLSCFNPLIGGADRATGGIPPFKKCMTQIAFQSPHRRGGSRDEESLWMTNFSGDEFQSPHRRGGSRDTSVRHHVCEKVGGLFQSPHRRGGSRDGQCNGSCWRAQQGMFQSPHRRGGSRDPTHPPAYTFADPSGFNPLIGGADRATKKVRSFAESKRVLRFNPLIGGADRATALC